ncbi:AAA family ATPase [Rheinheimera sp. NSM]|uniref:AAA family ATPase n=1 Tax=Rheinheimera sp. NSM TaxID=3457884 RepID=UPI004036B268
MLNTMELVEPSEIKKEIDGHDLIAVIETGSQTLPYQSMTAEQFECLLWDLFRSGYESELGHDYSRLMISGADQGRDVWLTRNEQSVGLVQCKRYAHKISLAETLREIIKFVLYTDISRQLLPKPEGFTFYLSLSSDPSGEVDEFFSTPKTWLKDNQSEIEKQAIVVINKYSKLRKIVLAHALPSLLQKLMLMEFKLLRPHELNRALSIHNDVRDRHFKFPGSLLRPLSLLLPTNTITQDDLKHASRQLACWQKTIENRFIERAELQQLLDLVSSGESNCYLLTGVAGSGKSSLLSTLYERLSDTEYSVLAVKADELDVGINDLADLAENLKLNGSITNALLGLAQTKPVVLLIDQMDAVSEVMDQSSNRFRVLVDLVLSLKSRFEASELSNRKSIHIIISSRPFEASFDTRFTQLGAKLIQLSLPSREMVEGLLTDIGIDKSSVPRSMYPALQVPFALNLYISLITAGESPDSITSNNLLHYWLEKKLTDRSSRARQLDFLKLLAKDMVNHEVLRRPVSVYQLEYGPTITALEAAGIIVRSEDNIGFNHQTWLDDFQAQSFRCSADMCAFVYRKQDGLFSRSTILRGIEFLREYNPIEYLSTLDELLFNGQTRRHIQHLLVDILAISPVPSFYDAQRVLRLIHGEPVLAKRAFWKIALNWHNWRELLIETLPELMGSFEHTESAIEWLAAEAKHNEDHVLSLISRLWSDDTYDCDVLRVLLKAVPSSKAAFELIDKVLSRTKIDESYVSRYVRELFKLGHAKQAIDLLVLWLDSVDIKTAMSLQMYGLEKFAKQYSIEVAHALLPWAVKLIGQSDLYTTSYRSFRRMLRLDYGWDEKSENGYLLSTLRQALTTAAKNSPDELLELIRQFMTVQIDDVQVMIATSLAANAEYFRNDIYDFLLENDYRMQLGESYFTGPDNYMFSVSGSCTMQLIEEVVAFWSEDQLNDIKDSIERFEVSEPVSGASVDMRRQNIRDCEEYRLKLLARLPSKIFSSRRHRQISERNRTFEPAIGERPSGVGLASFTRSPMSAEQMMKAKDSDIINLFNETTDQNNHVNEWRRRYSGIAQEFGAFAAKCPQRAIKIITGKFKSSVHERSVSEAIESMAKSEHASPSEIRGLILELNQRNFNSKEWINAVARAFREIAIRENGLEEDDIQLLKSYLNVELYTGNELEKDSASAELGGALLFGHNNGSRLVPGGNYALMSAIYHGILCRQPTDCDIWADALLSFFDISKEVETWKCLLLFQAHPLLWADQQKCNTLVRQLLDESIAVFSEPKIAMTIWELFDLLQPALVLKIIDYWFSMKSPALSQVAGELTTGLIILGKANQDLQAFWQRSFDSGDFNFRRGVVYAACAGWNETGKIRGDSHNILMSSLKDKVDGLGIALNAAFPFDKRIPNDELTFEVITWLAENPSIIAELDKYRLFSCLVKINFSPKLQLCVLNLAQKFIEAKQSDNSTHQSFEHSEGLVQLAVTLQRSPGPLKERAMQLYETLLDAGVYHAEEAAEQALRL